MIQRVQQHASWLNVDCLSPKCVSRYGYLLCTSTAYITLWQFAQNTKMSILIWTYLALFFLMFYLMQHSWPPLLTYWGRDQIDAMSQTTFSNAFSRMKMNKFCLGFHWSLFLRFELTIFQHWFRWWLGADQATSHYLNQWWLVYWHIYASLGLNELKRWRYIPQSCAMPPILSFWDAKEMPSASMA